jgi:uncharacterized membrane protein
MKCPRCQRESRMDAEYCVQCGASLFGGGGPGGRAAAGNGLPEVRQQLNQMGLRLSAVEGRVSLISERLGIGSLDVGAAVAEVPAVATGGSIPAVRLTPESLSPASVADSVAVEKSPITVVPVAPARPAQKPPPPRQPSQFASKMREWEQSLPGNWLSRIGMLVLFIGLGFLTQWAYANDKLVRIPLLLVGLACGGALLWGGHHWRKEYGAWAQALTGGGIGVLYLSLFASYALYAGDPEGPVMNFYATFGLMFVVTALAVVIALRRESMAIAIIGIVGAFLVPIILSASDLHQPAEAGGDSHPGLMIAYILVLDAAVVWLSTFRNWRWFTLLGFAGSLAVYGLWYANSGHEGSVSAAEWSLSGIFLCFVAATTLFHVVGRRAPQLADQALMSMNAAIYFCVSYALLWGKYQEWLGLFSVGLCVLYAVIGYLAWRRSEGNRLLSLFAFAIAIVFLTIAIPVQLHRSYASWITAAWAVEGAALIWIAARQNMPKWQLWGVGALAMALVGLIVFNGIIDQERYRPFINDTFWAFTIGIVAFYAAAYFLRDVKKALQPWFFPAIMLVASLLTMWLLSAEIVSAAGSKMLAAQARGAAVLDLRNIENARSLGLVSLWAAYGFCLLVAGTWRKWDWLRVAAYGLVALACAVTGVLLNHQHALVGGSGSLPFINYGFGAFAICTLTLYLVARVAVENREKLRDFDRVICLVAVGAANVLTVWALSAEIITFVDGPGVENVRNLLLVILWAGYGSALMAVGVWKNALLPRIGGSGLMAMGAGATAVLLNHSHAHIVRGDSMPIVNISFGGFAICVAGLYLLAYLASQHKEQFESFDRPVRALAMVLANVLTLWALSAEVITFLGYSANLRSLMLVILWSGYGLLLVLAGAWKSVPAARFSGYGVIGIAGFMALILLNHSHAVVLRTNSDCVANYSFGGLLIGICGIYAAVYAMARHSKELLPVERAVFGVLVVAANALSLYALSSEVWTYAGGEQARNMGLTVLWAAYGLALMVAGIIGRWPRVRLGGLGLVSLAIVKLFLYDMVRLGGGYRVAAFVITGVLLLAGGFVYHRYADVIKGFIMDRPEKGTGPDRK